MPVSPHALAPYLAWRLTTGANPKETETTSRQRQMQRKLFNCFAVGCQRNRRARSQSMSKTKRKQPKGMERLWLSRRELLPREKQTFRWYFVFQKEPHRETLVEKGAALPAAVNIAKPPRVVSFDNSGCLSLIVDGIVCTSLGLSFRRTRSLLSKTC